MQIVTFPRIVAVAIVAMSLSACSTNEYGQPVVPTNTRNAAIGAAAGAVAAKAFDGNATKGALAGATAGALACDAGLAVC